ncbi:hypothetical protein SCHPADRAFT_947549 [Schizopora paradoxa]|uniref:Uncharacterized protein n=1 Tax=Schizopora paradoxa TaxID=27342 RepID=A0A0H2R596_9AGAM|nr:hypothetical protein SCHPADRAFT_947549 [Schizopora paradoxa]
MLDEPDTDAHKASITSSSGDSIKLTRADGKYCFYVERPDGEVLVVSGSESRLLDVPTVHADDDIEVIRREEAVRPPEDAASRDRRVAEEREAVANKEKERRALISKIRQRAQLIRDTGRDGTREEITVIVKTLDLGEFCPLIEGVSARPTYDVELYSIILTRLKEVFRASIKPLNKNFIIHHFGRMMNWSTTMTEAITYYIGEFSFTFIQYLFLFASPEPCLELIKLSYLLQNSANVSLDELSAKVDELGTQVKDVKLELSTQINEFNDKVTSQIKQLEETLWEKLDAKFNTFSDALTIALQGHNAQNENLYGLLIDVKSHLQYSQDQAARDRKETEKVTGVLFDSLLSIARQGDYEVRQALTRW